MFKELLKKASHLLPDKTYIKLKYYSRMGRFPDLKNPKTFNEKLQWLKLYNRKPEYTRMVDKYEAKKYVAEIIGEEYIIPTLGVWEKFDDIDFDALPDQFVLKCTHDSGGLVICRDKSKLDIDAARKKIEKCLKVNYFWQGREWPYKNVTPRIIAEQYLEDECGHDFDRFIGHKKNIYTTEWKLCDFSFNYPAHPEIEIPKPAMLQEMLELSKKLAVGEPYIRTDFYCIGNKIYFGELTFFPASGYGSFKPDNVDYELGQRITLPEEKIK